MYSLGVGRAGDRGPSGNGFGEKGPEVTGGAPALDGLVRELEDVLENATAENLPEVLGLLERARGRAMARIVQAPAKPAEDPLLTMQEVASRLGITVNMAREMGRRGELPTVLVGDRFVRVRRSSLEQWIKAREAGGKIR